MQQLLMTIAGSIIGFWLPECVYALSPHADKSTGFSVGANIALAIAVGIVFNFIAR